MKKRIVWLRTRWEWARRGKRVKPGCTGLLVPFVPTRPENLHIRSVRLFSSDEVTEERLPLMLTEQQRYKPLETFAWARLVYFKDNRRPGRPRWRARFMDKYWFVPVKGMKDHDFDNVAPRVRVIYPAQGTGTRHKKSQSERPCQACSKPFMAKREDAKYCGPACRKWASRRVTDNCEF